MKRRLIAVLLALCAACSSGDLPPASSTPLPPAHTQATPTPTAPGTPEPEPTRAIQVDTAALDGVTVTFWHVWDGARGALINAFVAEFNAQNPYGITVAATRQPDIHNAVRAALAAGTPPDVATGFNHHTRNWAGIGAGLVDLTGYATDPAYGFSSAELADFYPLFWGQDMDGGLALPFYRTADALFYNTTWARELGFDAPPATPADLQIQTCAANAAKRQDTDLGNDATGGLMLGFEPGALAAWLYAFGGGLEPFTEGNAYGFDRPENANAFRFLRGLLDTNCAWVPEGQPPHEPFAARQGLLFPATLGSTLTQEAILASAGLGDEWAVIPYPAVDGAPAALVSGPGLALFATTAERQLAGWLFIQWLVSTDNLMRWSEATGYFPVRASAFEALADFRGQHPAWAGLEAVIPVGRAFPVVESWPNVQWVVSDAAQVLFAPLVTLDEIPALLAELQLTAEEVAGLNR